MTYVALLRGINVGGKRKVEMARLKALFERLGLTSVRTYINSGNVVFVAPNTNPAALTRQLATAIEAEFGFPVMVIVHDAGAIERIASVLPESWADGADAKCDVMFLASAIDSETVLEQLTIKPSVDDVRFVPGAVLWRVERPNVTRSGMMKLVGTPIYAQMTVRNCNTLRKLVAIVRGR